MLSMSSCIVYLIISHLHVLLIVPFIKILSIVVSFQKVFYRISLRFLGVKVFKILIELRRYAANNWQISNSCLYLVE